MIQVMSLWANKSKGGKIYFSGNLGGCRVYLFKNTKKEGDNPPSFHLCIEQIRGKINDDNLNKGVENERTHK